MGDSLNYLEALIQELSRLPGIGSKSASRLAFHILNQPHDQVDRLARALVELKENIKTCSVCGGISDYDVCSICSDKGRDENILCIVKDAKDILTIEGTGEFKGKYHVLMGLISPLDGMGPEDLNISSLLKKCSEGDVKELILALNPTIEGDATALYLSKIITPIDVKVTRIAHGLPVGSDLEFADSATIIKSFKGRVELPG